MSTNLLDLSLKRTDAVNYRCALEALITEQFTQHPSDFDSDIGRLEALRIDALIEPVSPNSLDKLIVYNSQLSYIATKLPNDIGVDFAWYSATNSSVKHTFDDLSWEKANVLLNIAVTYACLGVRENRSTGDGLKKAHQQFQQAAGCLTSLSSWLETVHCVRTDDLQVEYLSFLISTMLAQAQECIWQKAVIDRMKDKLIAQLSQEVSRLYESAARSLEQSTAMSPAWLHHLRIKSLHFAAAAQVRMSSVALVSTHYGEEVARLRLASELCKRAQKHLPYVSSVVSQDLNGLSAHVESNRIRAEKDNDMIYVIPVPVVESLTQIVSQAMAKAVSVPQIDQPLLSAKPEGLLFRHLIPFVVRNASDIFQQRKDEFVSKEIVNRLHALDLEMQGLLQELGLPASLTVMEQPLSLPATLKPQAEEVRGIGGSNYLEEMLEQVASLAAANKELVEQIIDLMDEEAMDAATNPEVVDSDKLLGYRNQINQYESFLVQAQISDDQVRAKVGEWRIRIDLLTEDDATLVRSIPKGKRLTVSRENESAARKLRFLLNRWDLIFKERKSQVANVRMYAESDDITPDLVQFARTFEAEHSGQAARSEDFEDLISQRLAHYASKASIVLDSAATQTKIVQEIRSANESFQSTKSPTNSNSEREKVLQDLDTAYHKYREIVNNLEEGSKFYNDFHKALCRVSDEVKAAIAQIHEARSREQDLVAATIQLEMRDDRDTIISPTSTIQAGTWHPDHGIAFSTPSKPATRSSTRIANAASAQSEGKRTQPPRNSTFDPSRHTIQFSQ